MGRFFTRLKILYLSRSHPIKTVLESFEFQLYRKAGLFFGLFLGNAVLLGNPFGRFRIQQNWPQNSTRHRRFRKHRHARHLLTLPTSYDDWIYDATNVPKCRARWEPRIDLNDFLGGFVFTNPLDEKYV